MMGAIRSRTYLVVSDTWHFVFLAIPAIRTLRSGVNVQSLSYTSETVQMSRQLPASTRKVIVRLSDVATRRSFTVSPIWENQPVIRPL